MSLINKVLLDLDNRTQSSGAAANQSLFSNLHPVGAPSSSSPPRWVWALAASLLIFGLAGAAWYYKHHARVTSSEPVTNQASVAPVKVDAPEKSASAQPPAPPLPAAEAKPTPVPRENKPVETPHAKQDAPAVPHEAAPVSAPPAAATPDRGASAPPAAAVSPKEQSSLERTVLPLSPGEKAENLYREGVGLIRSGQEQEGERALQTALAIDPTHTAARETFSVVLLEQHRFEEAKHLLSDGIAILPSYAPFSSRLARLYVEQGDEARALTLLEHNRAQTTPDAAYLGLLGTLYQRSAKPEAARDTFRLALGLQPDEERWWMGLGISLEALHDWAAARDAYQRCLASTQTEPRVHQYAEQRLGIVSRHLP